MGLSDKQKAEAERLYQMKHLSDDDHLVLATLKSLDGQLDALQDRRDDVASKCSHPLIMRDTQHCGSDGGWDRTSSYWTTHKCNLCDKRWTTNQRWKQVGGKHGHPDDPLAVERND